MSLPRRLLHFDAIGALVIGESRTLLRGGAYTAAVAIAAQLAHRFGFGPIGTEVCTAEEREGLIRGVFVWRGKAYQFEAKAVTEPRG